MGLAFLRVEVLAAQPLDEGGFAGRAFAQEDDFDFVERGALVAKLLEVFDDGFGAILGEFDGWADEGAIKNI